MWLGGVIFQWNSTIKWLSYPLAPSWYALKCVHREVKPNTNGLYEFLSINSHWWCIKIYWVQYWNHSWMLLHADNVSKCDTKFFSMIMINPSLETLAVFYGLVCMYKTGTCTFCDNFVIQIWVESLYYIMLVCVLW